MFGAGHGPRCLLARWSWQISSAWTTRGSTRTSCAARLCSQAHVSHPPSICSLASSAPERVPALVGAAFVAFATLFVYFGHRAFAEAASMLPLTLGFALAVGAVDRWRDHPRARELFWAGVLLLGFSVHLRLQNALFCLGLLIVLGWKSEWRASLHACFAFGIALLVLAIVDLAIWGEPAHSTREYLEFWLGGEGAAHWQIRPFGWYATELRDLAPAVTGILVIGAVPWDLSRPVSVRRHRRIGAVPLTDRQQGAAVRAADASLPVRARRGRVLEARGQTQASRRDRLRSRTGRSGLRLRSPHAGPSGVLLGHQRRPDGRRATGGYLRPVRRADRSPVDGRLLPAPPSSPDLRRRTMRPRRRPITTTPSETPAAGRR